jgi:acyl carrier protein
MQDVKAVIHQFLLDNFMMGDDAVVPDTASFMKHHILDSTGFLELIGFVEDTFHIRVADEEMVPENFDSIMNVDRYVRRKCAQPAPLFAAAPAVP